MMQLLVVGAGGFVGSVCRYLLSGLAQQLGGTSAFPVGTLTVNIVGCAIVGFLAYVADVHGGLSSLQRLLPF
jgi:CrcB protein